MNVTNELGELKHDLAILESFCIQTSAGLEAIDPKTFLNHLRKLTERSTLIVKHILNERNVQIEFTPAHTFTLDKRVLKTPFTKVGRNSVYVPLGFEGSISDFLEFLFANREGMLQTEQALIDANTVFAEYVQSPELLSKLDPRRVPVLEKLDNLPKEFAEFFNGVEGADRLAFEDAYKSYGDFSKASQLIEKLTKDFMNIKLNDVKGRVEDFYQTLELITAKLDKGETEVTKPTAKAIGNLIYHMADWVAVYSLYLTKLFSVVKSHHDTTKKLNGFF